MSPKSSNNTSSPEASAIVESVLGLVGDTPLVKLGKIGPENGATILGKFEVFNPAGSVKDRIALAMIEAAEKDGTLKRDDILVEATSGNTGIGLAVICAYKDYRLVITMPDDMSQERRELLQRLGAEVVMTPAVEGMTGAVHKANELVASQGYVMLQQFNNPANPEIHYRTTGPEILKATSNKLDVFVAGVGSGGTITGVGRAIKEAQVSCTIVAVEPANSPVLQGGRAGQHLLQGMGASFIPSILDQSVYSEIVSVNDGDALETTKRLAKEEGLLVGISAGANVFAAIKIAEKLEPHQRVVTMLCDTGERYLSVPF